ncbi:hypothetical protein AVEN_35851-1 [Araneus ventricosus]|uniref:Uncharacterized protein n=1 Tax=Araneus ventricosus TaxID=182803 RepID=A0A4Y2BJS2_ARAVE|nr:hypothetical protein AVEN_35851-1 [Araneus ventricosus]
MNAVSIPGSEEFEVLSPSCVEIVQDKITFNGAKKTWITVPIIDLVIIQRIQQNLKSMEPIFRTQMPLSVVCPILPKYHCSDIQQSPLLELVERREPYLMRMGYKGQG